MKHATPAIKQAVQLGLSYQLHEYEHNPQANSYGLEAATVLQVDPARVFKTLIVKLANSQLVAVLVPASKQVNLKAVATAFQVKGATMADPTEAERSTGYIVGGISPLGQRKRLRTAIDASVTNHETVLVSGGRRGLMLELAPADLMKACEAIAVPLTRNS
jgi:Cys-tRNA(Pro)/Cys-tRNA(Cys) deacylase